MYDKFGNTYKWLFQNMFKKVKVMKGIIVLLFFVCSYNSIASISIDGFYQGKNLYVQSSLCGDGFGFCATKVTVNGNIVPSQTGKGAFEINFNNFNFTIGEHVFIVIEHHNDCKPKIINPEVLLPNSTFIVESITCDNEGRLNWSTTNESGKLVFQIEQYKWNKWIVIGEVNGEGRSSKTSYFFDVIPHSGENKIRVSQTDNSGKKRTSKEIKFTSKVKSPSLVTDNSYQTVKFVSDGRKVETKYEIYDAYGNILKKGLNDEVDFSNLAKGVYYINFDNKNKKIIKKQ